VSSSARAVASKAAARQVKTRRALARAPGPEANIVEGLLEYLLIPISRRARAGPF